MKKIFSTIMTLALAAFVFTSCEDVPMPYNVPGEGGSEEGGTTEIVAKGTGTLADPYNIAGVLEATANLETGANMPEKIAFTGIVTSLKECSQQYGNATFYLGDEENSSKTFYVYRCLGINNKNVTSDDLVKEGDEITVYGTITNYNGTIETSQKGAYIVKIVRNGEVVAASDGAGDPTPDPVGEAKGTGTEADPFNVAGIINYTKALGADVNSDKEVYFTGTVESFKSGEEPGNSYGNATFYIKDESTSEKFYCFRVMGPNNEKFTSADQLKVGQTVTVRGLVVNYKGNTPETVTGKAYVVKIDGEGTAVTPDPTPDPNPDPVTPVEGNYLVNGDFEAWTGGQPDNWKSTTTASSATLKQSTDAHTGSYAVIVAGNETANKRLAYKEITLEAGEYTFSFYAKATTSDASQVRPGYVPVNNGSVGSYTYGDYATLSTSWTLVTYTFTLDKTTTLNLVVMNPKKSNYSSAKDVILDDATLIRK